MGAWAFLEGQGRNALFSTVISSIDSLRVTGLGIAW